MNKNPLYEKEIPIGMKKPLKCASCGTNPKVWLPLPQMLRAATAALHNVQKGMRKLFLRYQNMCFAMGEVLEGSTASYAERLPLINKQSKLA